MNILRYEGYWSQPVWEGIDNVFFGKLEGIRDLVSWESKTEDGIEKSFHDTVDEYLKFCAEVGKTPERCKEESK